MSSCRFSVVIVIRMWKLCTMRSRERVDEWNTFYEVEDHGSSVPFTPPPPSKATAAPPVGVAMVDDRSTRSLSRGRRGSQTSSEVYPGEVVWSVFPSSVDYSRRFVCSNAFVGCDQQGVIGWSTDQRASVFDWVVWYKAVARLRHLCHLHHHQGRGRYWTNQKSPHHNHPERWQCHGVVFLAVVSLGNCE